MNAAPSSTITMCVRGSLDRRTCSDRTPPTTSLVSERPAVVRHPYPESRWRAITRQIVFLRESRSNLARVPWNGVGAARGQGGDGRRARYAGDGGGSDPILRWRARRRLVGSRRWGWNPNGAGRVGSCAAVSVRSTRYAVSVSCARGWNGPGFPRRRSTASSGPTTFRPPSALALAR